MVFIRGSCHRAPKKPWSFLGDGVSSVVHRNELFSLWVYAQEVIQGGLLDNFKGETGHTCREKWLGIEFNHQWSMT